MQAARADAGGFLAMRGGSFWFFFSFLRTQIDVVAVAEFVGLPSPMWGAHTSVYIGAILPI
jgi:hypothetical protein